MFTLRAKILIGIFAALILTAIGLAISTYSYKTLYDTKSDALTSLEESVKEQNATAQSKLERLTAERDAKQTLLDEQAKEQGAKDALAIAEIDRLSRELDNRPIRVRYLPAPGGKGSGGAEGDEPRTAGTGTEDLATIAGVLPEANSRRLRAAIAEVETLSAAYASCRSTLYTRQQVTASL